MALESDNMADLIPKEEDMSMVNSEDVLTMTQFEEEAGNLIASDMQAVGCVEDNVGFASEVGEVTEQFLTISQGVNQISVNDDGSIIYSEPGLAPAETAAAPLEEPQSVDSPFVSMEGNTFYFQPNEGLEDQIMNDEMLPSPTDEMPEFSGNTFLYNKADGTLTQVSNTQNNVTLSTGTVVNRAEVKNVETVQPEVKAVKRPAFLASGSPIKMGTRKVFLQSTSRGPVIKTMPPSIQKFGGAKTISLAQAQRMGLLSSGSGQNKIFIKKVSSGGLSSASGSSSIVMRQPVKMMPRPLTASVVKPQAFRTVAPSPQLKTIITNTMPQQRAVVLNKTGSGFSLAGRPTQKLTMRPNSGLVRMQIGGKQQLVKVISNSSSVKPKLVTLGKQQNAMFLPKSSLISKQVSSLLKTTGSSSMTLKGKTISITPSQPQPAAEIVTLDDEPVTIKLEDDQPSEPQYESTPIVDLEIPDSKINNDEEEDRELMDEEEEESPSRPDSPQKLLVANGIRPKKPCNCTRSQCLKLYCECFANGEFCFECNCSNCFNNIDHEEDRQVSITSCLERNPDAFRRKMQVATALSDSEEEKERRQNRGCNCKKSHCLKNYCECFEGKLNCCESCKCTGCRNTEGDMEAWMRGEAIDSGDEGRDVAGKGNPFMPKALAEALCQCILVQAELSDRAGQDTITTEQRIIEELGQRLVQIIGNRNKKDSR